MSAATNGTRYLAIDMGAESSRAIVGTFTGDTLELEELHRFPSRNVVLGRTRYWDFLYIFGEIKEALRLYGQNYDQPLEGVGADSWGVDFGLLSQSRQLLANPVHYRDHRTDDVMDEAFEVVPKDVIYERTGIAFQQFNTLYQLWAMHRTAPAVLQAARTLLLMPDLVHYFLCGVRCCEYTNATTTQLLNVYRKQWSRSLMQAFSLPMGIMPDVVQPGTVLAPLRETVAAEAGIQPANVIAPATHDTGSAYAAVPAAVDTWACISCGTWSLMGTELQQPITSPQAFAYNFTNEGGICDTIRFIKNIMGLWVLQQCRGEWAKQGDEYSYAELAEMAGKAEPFACVINIDDQAFYNPPSMLEAVKEQIQSSGQEVPDTVGGLARAIIEGLAIRYAIVLDQLAEVTNRDFEAVHMVGGGIKNTLLCQLASDAMGVPVIAGPTEATAMGNFVAQAMATGRISSHAEARKLIQRSGDLTTFEPQNPDKWKDPIARVRQMAG